MENKTLLILFLSYDKTRFAEGFNDILKVKDADILVVDDASESVTEEALDDTGIIFIRHAIPLGFGGCFSSGLRYARDMGYDIAVFLDTDNGSLQADAEQMIENMSYGYDIVSCSRILENKAAESFSKDSIAITEAVSDAVAASGLDLTDPLSGILAVRTEAISGFELTEENHGVLLQLWIQAAYFRLTTMELPSVSGNSFGTEFGLYEDPMGELLAVLETEKYLYPKRV